MLQDKYQDRYQNTRWLALQLLQALGPDAAEAIPVLIEGLDEYPSKNHRLHAMRVLGAIGPAAKPAVPALSKYLAEEDDKIRKAALDALRRITKQQIPKSRRT